MNRNGGVIADTLFAGITRPALALGVPYAALLLNGFVTLELFLVTHNLLALLVCAPIHAVAWLLCLAEPRFFELLTVRIQVRARGGAGGSRRWGARSYAALGMRVSTNSAELPAAVVEAAGRRVCDPR